MKIVTGFIFLGSKITMDVDCSHQIKTHFLFERKVMPNLNSVFKSQDTILTTNVHIVKAMVFPGDMCRCESWTIKKIGCQGIEDFELWC